MSPTFPPSPRRRALIAALGAAGAASALPTLLVPRSAGAASCTLSPSLTEGPYFVDERLDRSDITGGQSGTTLTMTIALKNVACQALSNVMVDIWHCNASGQYSDISQSQGSGTSSTKGQTYLRGYQVSDGNGVVTFKTIFPGWYSGRTPHIHFMARFFDGAGNQTYEFTTQFFFVESQIDAIYATAPYASRPNRDTTNARDGIYSASMLTTLASDGSGGYTSSSTIGLALDASTSTAAVNLNQHGLTGNWYNPATNGQGFNIEVFPDLVASGTGFLYGGWFTYDTVAGGAERQRWYSIQGKVAEGASTASLVIGRNVGGNFDAGPATVGTQVGSATLSFSDCNTGSLAYAFSDGSGRTGTIPLKRLAQDPGCSASGNVAEGDADYGLSGNWYEPATSGQGLIIEVNEASSTAFVTWYTYAPDGASASGDTSQRWYAVQGPYSNGARASAMTIYEATGGVFDAASPAPAGVAVGTATLSFASCARATLDYAFTTGSNAGRSGRLDLQRLAATPAVCAA